MAQWAAPLGNELKGFLVNLHGFMAKADQRFGQRDGSDQNFDYMFKLLIIGNSSVGKTSFLFRYADDSFSNSFVSTVGIDFKVKTVYRNDKRIKLQIWVRMDGFMFVSYIGLSTSHMDNLVD
ncbi:Ras-related protein Rab-3C [Liparis tanakae]|uniref:small monomeric GTPase n=1 Tax=Liparis tanakae TaxID=230148 RepID=A0A4Z2H0Y9_9TELE|nr:Ras-related protein Rab-3C [Liparis tanakae]